MPASTGVYRISANSRDSLRNDDDEAADLSRRLAQKPSLRNDTDEDQHRGIAVDPSFRNDHSDEGYKTWLFRGTEKLSIEFR